MFYFSHENRIYGLTFLDDTNGQKKAEVNELGLKLADTLLNYRIAGAAPLIKIPRALISDAKDKNWDIAPRNIPSEFENPIDTIWEYFADN